MAAATTRGSAGKKGNTTGTKIRVSPFRLTVKPMKAGGFVCEFSGTDSQGRKIEIELEFPAWWVGELMDKIGSFKKG